MRASTAGPSMGVSEGPPSRPSMLTSIATDSRRLHHLRTAADAQSKVDIAINEAERLLNDTKVDMLMGVYSSAQCVPLSAKVDAAQKFWWATVCIASGVFKDKNLKYVFRPTVHSDQYGQGSC